jgi:stearoyl-CoA desaturase (delta-9 desaturase)
MSTTLQELDLDATESGTRAETIANDLIRRLQRRHFWVYNVVPFVGFVGALVSLRWLPIGAVEVSLLAGMWALSMTGMSLGLHRYFAHRAFETSRRGRAALAVLGCMAAQGPLVSWVSVHRRHHERSDKPGDPHSPNPDLLGEGRFPTLRGLWHAHVGWLTSHEYPNPVRYAPELLRDRTVGRITRHYELWVALGLLVPAVLGGLAHGSWLGALQGFLWGGLVRMVVVDHSVLSINSFSHAFGGHDFETDDHSRNNAWVALPTFGESWQNNHHAFASSAAIGLRWWQVDLGYWLIAALERLGLVWQVRRPTAAMMKAKRVQR